MFFLLLGMENYCLHVHPPRKVVPGAHFCMKETLSML